jgi:hypothetical protein
MGTVSREKVQEFSPEACADGLTRAFRFACNGRA